MKIIDVGAKKDSTVVKVLPLHAATLVWSLIPHMIPWAPPQEAWNTARIKPWALPEVREPNTRNDTSSLALCNLESLSQKGAAKSMVEKYELKGRKMELSNRFASYWFSLLSLIFIFYEMRTGCGEVVQRLRYLPCMSWAWFDPQQHIGSDGTDAAISPELHQVCP